MKKTILLLFTFSTLLLSNQKYLILAEGNGWFPHMAINLIKNHDKISKLPFHGFVVVGNTFTERTMRKDHILKYHKVWNELKGLKDLYPKKHNFLQINIDFPADYWNDSAWEMVTQNFYTVAKVAKELGFKGIVFDDEPYVKSAKKMINFKFPTKNNLIETPKKYNDWEKKGAEEDWVDKSAYRNPKYTFQEHTQKVQSRFKAIMKAMVRAYPKLTVLVYLGPSLSHANSNKEYLIVINMGLARENELHGPIFVGLKQGLGALSSLHDMGESYKYRKDKHFGYAYQWRKNNIAKNRYNDLLDNSYQWIVPISERKTWSKEVQVGFMVFNKGQISNYKEYNTLKTSSREDIGNTLNKALKYSDKYVIYYCHNQDWLLAKDEPLTNEWMSMMKNIHNNNTK
ncbi:MAG TPA: hypothetical protein EYG73_08925 [Arcobacter sp.]|nr:hypothetical protein [Arcobacter sp.]